MILKGYIFAVIYGVLCLGIGLILYKLGLPKKYTRKSVHILVGFEWLILYLTVGNSIHFLAVCLMFLALLLVVYFKKLMPMISSDSDNAPGTVYYALAMSGMSVICLFVPKMILPFGIGVFCTSFGDGFAGVVGQLIKKCNPKIYKNKSLWGCVANFLFSALSAFLISYFFNMNLNLLQCAMIGFFSVGIEIITEFGLDNITITFGTAFLAYAFLNFSTINYYVVPILLTPWIIAVVRQKKVLTPLGLAFALVLDFFVSFVLGNAGFVLLLSFLVISVVFDKIKKHRKKTDDIAKHGDCRNHIQVVANGLVPMLMAVMYSATLNHAFIVGYVAALAEALGDTAASGMGVYSRSTFDLFRMKKCKCGLSGGVSVIGTVFAIVGCAIISVIALLFGVVNVKLMLVAMISGFLGTMFDTFLGSVFQIKYKCRVCGEIVEKEIHCEKPTEKHSGFEFFDNDVVNFFSGIFSAVLAVILFFAVMR